jgi:hypothetical protein
MLEHILKYMAAGSLVIGVLAIYFTVRNNTHQIGAQIFLSYSDRVWTIRRAAIFDTKDSEAVTAAVFLVFELFELKRRGYVSRSIWSIWDNDIADLFRSDAFREHWIGIRPRLKNHPHFLQWVDGQLDDAGRSRSEASSQPVAQRALRLQEPD